MAGRVRDEILQIVRPRNLIEKRVRLLDVRFDLGALSFVERPASELQIAQLVGREVRRAAPVGASEGAMRDVRERDVRWLLEHRRLVGDADDLPQPIELTQLLGELRVETRVALRFGVPRRHASARRLKYSSSNVRRIRPKRASMRSHNTGGSFFALINTSSRTATLPMSWSSAAKRSSRICSSVKSHVADTDRDPRAGPPRRGSVVSVATRRE